MKNINDYIDQFGLIVNRGDGTESGGGDTLNKEGHYWFAKGISFVSSQKRNQSFLQVEESLRYAPGVYFRHPSPPYNEPFRGQWATSRDQMRPWICAMWAVGDQSDHKLNEIYHWLETHHWFGPNFKFFSDLNGDHFGIEIQQILELSYHFPINRKWKHFLADLSRTMHCIFQCLSSHIGRIFQKDQFVGNTVNLIPEVIWAHYQDRLLAKFNLYLLQSWHYGGPQWCYDWYFRQDFAPPINECMREPIDRFFGNWKVRFPYNGKDFTSN